MIKICELAKIEVSCSLVVLWDLSTWQALCLVGLGGGQGTRDIYNTIFDFQDPRIETTELTCKQQTLKMKSVLSSNL